MNSEISVGRKIVSTLIFWALLLFGPQLLLIVNIILPMPMREGELLYYIFIICLQGASAYIACEAADSFVKKSAPVLIAVNSLVAVAILLVMGYASLVSGDIERVISYGFAIVILIGAGAVPRLKGKKEED